MKHACMLCVRKFVNKQSFELILVAIESRSGFLHCAICKDFIYDPTFERIRIEMNPSSSMSMESTVIRSRDADLDQMIKSGNWTFYIRSEKKTSW